MPRFHCPADLAPGGRNRPAPRRCAPCAGAAPAAGRWHHPSLTAGPTALAANSRPPCCAWAAATCACRWAPTTPSSARHPAPSTCWRASPPTSAWTGWSKSHRTGRGQHHPAGGRAQRAQAQRRAGRQKARPLAGRGRVRVRTMWANRVPVVHRCGGFGGLGARPPAAACRPCSGPLRLLLSLREGTRPLLRAAAGAGPVWFLSGPEGGLECRRRSPGRAARLRAHHAGPRVLRAETAPLAALAALTLA